MKKILLFLSLVIISSGMLFAEEITITTYYPSPYGVYNSLLTDKLGVGDNNSDGSITSADVPTTTGNVWIKGIVRINSLTADKFIKTDASKNLVSADSSLVNDRESDHLSGGGSIPGTYTADVYCESGYVLTGGGFDFGRITEHEGYYSRPSSSGTHWECAIYLPSGSSCSSGSESTACDSHCYALCAKL